MTAADTHETPTTRAAACSGLPHDHSAWPVPAQAAYLDLLRQLDRASRDQALSALNNQWIADRAVRQAWEGTQAFPSLPPWPSVEDRGPLPLELRRWPAAWRYRVADLERSGRSRETAIGIARAEHTRHSSEQAAQSRRAA